MTEVSIIPTWKTAAQIYLGALQNHKGMNQNAEEGILQMADQLDYVQKVCKHLQEVKGIDINSLIEDMESA